MGDTPLIVHAWDDAEAAERYREQQAGYAIRHLEAVPVGNAKPYKAYVSVVEAEGPKTVYANTMQALADARTRDYVLQQAKIEAKAFASKYRHLKELADVVKAIDNVA